MKPNEWHVEVHRPEDGRLIAHLLFGESRRAQATTYGAHGLLTLRRQAAFLNERGKVPAPQCRADGVRPQCRQPSPDQPELFPDHEYCPKPKK